MEDNVEFQVTTTRSGVMEGVPKRLTPLSEYEKEMGMTMGETLGWIGIRQFSNTRGTVKLGRNREKELDVNVKIYVERKEKERAERLQKEHEERLKAEEERLRLEAMSRPNPKEKTIARAKVDEVEPTPESYTPLGVMAAIVIGVILLLRRKA